MSSFAVEVKKLKRKPFKSMTKKIFEKLREKFKNRKEDNCHRVSFADLRNLVCKYVYFPRCRKRIKDLIAATCKNSLLEEIIELLNKSIDAKGNQHTVLMQQALNAWNSSPENLRPGDRYLNRSIQAHLDPHVKKKKNGSFKITPTSKNAMEILDSELSCSGLKLGNSSQKSKSGGKGNVDCFFSSNAGEVSIGKLSPASKKIIKRFIIRTM